jgi:tetratricopeptide (TPR) repeat protein
MVLKTDLFLFVSHVREDRAAALEVVGDLERRGVPCWVAPRDVHLGKPFDDEIAEALENCWAMLLLFSDRCNENVYIRREVTVAGEIGKAIITFRIEDVQPRKALRVRLSDLNWIDGFVSREQAIDEVARIFAPAKEKTQPKPAPTGESEHAPGSVSAERAARDEAPTRTEIKHPESPAMQAAAVESALAGQEPGQRAQAVPSLSERRPPETPEQAPPKTAQWRGLSRRRVLIVGALAVTAVIGAIVTRARPPPPRDAAAVSYFKLGQASFERKDYAQAIADFNKAIDIDPKYLDAYFERGGAYLQRGNGANQDNHHLAKQDYEQAIADFTEVIRLETERPLLSGVYERRGFAYERRGFAYDRRGDAYYDNEDVRNQYYDRAIADFTEVIRLDPKADAWVWYWRGRIKGKKGDLTGSQADIAAAKAIDPNVDK